MDAINLIKKRNQVIDKMKNGIVLAVGAGMLMLLAGCNLPGAPEPTPFIFTTPDRTLTAIYEPLLTLTPEPVQAQTATLPFNTPAPFPTFTSSATSEATSTQAPTSTPVATQTRAATMRSGANIEAGYVDSALSIDGILEEWSLPAYPVRSVVYGGNARAGDGDLSASVMVGWDITFLYLGVRVDDDRYVQEASGLNIFKGDSLELLLDADLAGDFNAGSLTGDDYQLGISPGSPYPGESVQAYLWYPSSRQGGRQDVKIGARARDGGYDVEAAVPWNLFGITPENGSAYGFAFSVSDNDAAGEQVQESMVSTVSTRRLADPTTWGSLLLVRP